MALQAVLFDLDGVLIDSEPLGIEVAKIVLEEGGLVLSPGEIQNFVGVPDRDFYRRVVSKHTGHDANALLRRHTELYEASLHEVEIMGGAVEIVRSFKGKVLIGLVSGSTRRQIEQVLHRLGLSDVFDVIVSADDVQCGKPNPHCFALAAQRLKVQVVGCVAIEDSDFGLRAARGAGMWTVAFRPYSSGETRGLSDAVVERLSDITLPMLENLASGTHSNGLVLNLEASAWQSVAKELGRHLRRAEYLEHADPFDPWSILRVPKGGIYHRLFCLGHPVEKEDVRNRLGQDVTEGLLAIGVLRRSGGSVSAAGCIVGAFGQLLLIDRPVSKRLGEWHSAHTYLDESTVWYVHAVRSVHNRLAGLSALEIGPGSGIACVLLARGCVEAALGLDIDHASVTLSRFNVAMNGVDSVVQVELSDMFQYLENSSRRFDTIIFHPPYRIVPPDINYPNPTQRIGVGEDGLELVRRFISGAAQHLTATGLATLAVQLPQYQTRDLFKSLKVVAEENGLLLRYVPIGESISLTDIAEGIAQKFENEYAHGVRNNVVRYYQSLGIIDFKPLLLVLSIRGI